MTKFRMLPPIWLKRTIVRVVGVSNLVFALAGFLLVAGALSQRTVAIFEISRIFWVMTGVNILFLITLAASGIYILDLRPSGLRISNVLFSLELGYMLIAPALWQPTIRDSFGAAPAIPTLTGAGNLGLAPQFLTLYPLIALAMLNWFWPKTDDEPLPGAAGT